MVRTRYDTPAELFADLNSDIRNIRLCSFAALEKVRIDLAPTSIYQELSVANAWPDEYMRIAERINLLSPMIVNYQFNDPRETGLKKKKPLWKSW